MVLEVENVCASLYIFEESFWSNTQDYHMAAPWTVFCVGDGGN